MKKTTIYLTNHAYDRMRERLGLGRKAADRLVKRACERGIFEEEVTGRLSSYLRQRVYFFILRSYNIICIEGIWHNRKAYMATALIALAALVAIIISIEASALVVVIIQTIIGFVSFYDKEGMKMDKRQFGLVGVAFGADTFC